MCLFILHLLPCFTRQDASENVLGKVWCRLYLLDFMSLLFKRTSSTRSAMLSSATATLQLSSFLTFPILMLSSTSHQLFPHKQKHCVLCADNNNTKVVVHIPILIHFKHNLTFNDRSSKCIYTKKLWHFDYPDFGFYLSNFQHPNCFLFISSHLSFITPLFFRLNKWLLEPLLFLLIITLNQDFSIT